MANQENIQTGPVAGIKAGAVNAVEQHKATQEKEAQEANSLKPAKGDVLYIKQGDPVFNTIYGATNREINFIGGRFMVRSGDRDAAAIKEALDYFVDQGILQKEEG